MLVVEAVIGFNFLTTHYSNRFVRAAYYLTTNYTNRYVGASVSQVGEKFYPKQIPVSVYTATPGPKLFVSVPP